MSGLKEEGRTDDAARLKTPYTATLAQTLKEINNAVSKVSTDEAWRLLAQYQRTGDLSHREAFNEHVAAIRMRLREALNQ